MLGLFKRKISYRKTSKPNLYLHVGLPKTGTTTIQSLYQKNHAELAQRGILYPFVGRHGPGHVKIAQPYIRAKKRKNFEQPNARTPLENAISNRDNIIYELESSPTKINSVLISSEYFCECDEPQVDLFVEHYEHYFNIKVVVYLRRQDYLAESVTAQAYSVRHQNFYRESVLSGSLRLLNFHSIVSGWSKRLGMANVLPREYPEGVGDNVLIKGFNKTLSIDNIDTMNHHVSLNERLDRKAIEYIKLCDKLVFGEKVYFETISALRAYSKRSKTAPEHKKFYSPAQRQELLGYHLKGNAVISKQYFSGKLFAHCAEIDLNEPWELYPGLSKDDVDSIEQHLLNSAIDLNEIR